MRTRPSQKIVYQKYWSMLLILFVLSSAMIASAKGKNITPTDDLTIADSYYQDTTGKKAPSGIVRIKGKVTDEKGNPLPHATVMIMGKNKGVSADTDGEFEITTESASRLMVTYTGMLSSIVSVKEYVPGTEMVVKLIVNQESVMNEEVVVTGYQRTTTKMVAGSIVTLSPDKFMVPGIANLDGMLQGKVAGLNITNSSGSTTSSPSMRLRGTSTFVGNAEPLWVVDGIIRNDVTMSSTDANKLLDVASSAGYSIMGNAIAGVNPEDVESITFLKDASATAIYGVKASNGVIVVSTKKGKAGVKPVISFSANFGLTGRPTYDKLNRMNSKERIDVSEEMLQNGYSYENNVIVSPYTYEGLFVQNMNKQISDQEFQVAAQKLQTMNTDWMKLLFQNAFNQNYSLSMSGGSDKSTYYASLSYNDNKGSTIGDQLKRYQASLRLTNEFNKRLRTDFKIQGSYRKGYGFFGINPYDYAYNTSRTIDKDLFYPTKISTQILDNNNNIGLVSLNYNFLNEREHTSNTDNTASLDAMLELKYAIIKGLDFSVLMGYNYSNIDSRQWADEQSFYVAQIRKSNYGDSISGTSDLPFGGVLSYRTTNSSSYTIRPNLNYNKMFDGGRQQVTAMAGMEVRSQKRGGMYDTEYGYFPDRGNRIGYDYGNTGSYAIASSTGKHAVGLQDALNNNLSWFMTAAYNYGNRYVINGSIRTDASNRFGQNSNHKFLPIYSFSGKWNVAQEKFMDNVKFIDGLSLRASYGIQGSVVQSVGPELVVSYPTPPVDALFKQYYLLLNSLAYPDLRWEKTATTNLGLDMAFLKNRVRVSLDIYNRQGSDLLLSSPTAYELGITSMYYNGGKMVNRGIEFSLDVTPIKTENWTWSLSINGAKNKNISNSSQQYSTSMLSSTLVSLYLSGRAIVDGRPVDALYSYQYAGLDGSTGMPNYTFNNDPKGKTDPTVWLAYSGRSTPDFTGGMQTSLSYKSFRLSAAFNYVTGNVKRLNPLYKQSGPIYAPGPDQNLSKEFVNRWRQPGDEAYTDIPSITNYAANQNVTLPLSQTASANRYVMYDKSTQRTIKGSYLRCTNLIGAYSLPPTILKRIGVNSGTFNFGVSNLFVIADKKLHGQDPETAGFGGNSLPIMSTYTFGFNFSFN